MSGKRYGRQTAAWRRLRLQVLATSNICWLCNEPIDLSLSGRHRMGPHVDHVIPLNRGGALLDPNNCRPSHKLCNLKRGDSPPPGLRTSEEW